MKDGQDVCLPSIFPSSFSFSLLLAFFLKFSYISSLLFFHFQIDPKEMFQMIFGGGKFVDIFGEVEIMGEREFVFLFCFVFLPLCPLLHISSFFLLTPSYPPP